MFDQLPTSTRTRNTPGPLFAYIPVRTVTVEPQGSEEMETRVLLELLSAFPGFSLDDIAQAYTESDADVNAAAILLATRQPSMRSNDVQEGWTNSRKMDGYSRQSAEQPVVKSDDLLLEKYGRGVGELINQRQSNSLIHNVQSAHDGASHNEYHFNNRTTHGLRGDNRSTREEVVNKDNSYGISGDGALLVGRKKTKQKGAGALDEEVEVVDAKRQADEEFLLSMLGESSELGVGVVRDILDSFKGDLQELFRRGRKLSQLYISQGHAHRTLSLTGTEYFERVLSSLEVLLQMSSSNSPQAHDVDSTINQDGNYCDDKKLYDRRHSYFQRTESHVDKAPMQPSMEYQKCSEGFWNRPSLLPKAGNVVNGYTHQRSIKDKTDHDHYKVPLKQLKECFPHIPNSDLFHVLESNNFVLSDAVQVLLDATANKNLTSCRAEPNVGLDNRANTFKPNVLKENVSLVTARPPPLKAAWTDVKRTIIPLKQNRTDLIHGLTEKAPEGKNGSCDDYGRLRVGAHEHWRMMDYYFKEAAAAYNRGERCWAATLAEKGKEQKQLAQEADGRASQRIFQSRNKDIVNNITIDLHAQHVKEAINVLKRHLQTLCSVPSVHILTVITGYGSHSMNGRAKIKPAVTNFLARSGIPWEELNEGCLTIKMVDARNKQLDISDGE